MHNKRFYNDEMDCNGRRGRGRRMGRRGYGNRRGGYGPRADFIDEAESFGPPPWAGRWGRMAEDADRPESPEGAPEMPPRGMGHRMWAQADISAEERRAWLQARKARLQAWKQHLDDRLAETEAELAQLDAPAAGETAENAD